MTKLYTTAAILVATLLPVQAIALSPVYDPATKRPVPNTPIHQQKCLEVAKTNLAKCQHEARTKAYTPTKKPLHPGIVIMPAYNDLSVLLQKCDIAYKQESNRCIIGVR